MKVQFREIAFINANLITMTEDGCRENQVVFIQNGMVDKIGAANEIVIPESAQVVDCQGKYLMPGLADMHVHLFGDIFEGPIPRENRDDYLADIDRQLVNYIANGVTTVRNMTDPFTVRDNHVLKLKDEVASQKVFGPHIYTATNALDGTPVAFPSNIYFDSPEEAVAYIEECYEKGYDMIKVYSNLPAKHFDAVMDKAAELDIPVGGHWPQSVKDFEYGLRKGWKSIEHLSGFDLAINEGPLSETAFENHCAGWEYATEEKIIALADKVAKYDVFVLPNFCLKNIAVPNYERSLQCTNPDSRYQSEQFRRLENKEWWSPAFRAIHTQTLEARIRLTKELHDRNVTLLAGTDSGVPRMYIGASLFDELELLSQAGLSNFEVLKTATVNGAKFFNREHEFGSIKKGRSADLLLLDKNPLKNIANVRKQSGVMIRGQWFETSALKERLNNLYPLRK